MTDVAACNASGQQLFFADMHRSRLPEVIEERAVIRRLWPYGYPVAHQQLTLFESELDLFVRLDHIPPCRAPELGRALDQAVEEHGNKHGWEDGVKFATRRAIRILLSIQDTPGARIKASEVELLKPLRLYAMTTATECLSVVGMFEDDREPALEAWFRSQMTNVEGHIQAEVAEWFHAIRDGHKTAPRIRPRNITTVRQCVSGVKDALETWSDAGLTSLREVTRDDVIAVLPSVAFRQNQTLVGLRSLFRFLKANKTTFLNPTARLKAARVQPNFPLPVDVGVIRDAFDNSNPQVSAMAAIVIFHGLSTSELAAMVLTDIRDGHLAAGSRSIVIATEVREKIAAWLDVRNARWPNAINPHLFINKHTALRATPVSKNWIAKVLPVQVSKLREDCILGEAIASGGDARVLGDLFGLSTQGAERYTRAIEQDVLFSSGTHGVG